MKQREQPGFPRAVAHLCVWTALLLTGGGFSDAAADVYYYRDAEGVFHFTNVPTPETRPFIVEEPARTATASPSTGRATSRRIDYDLIIREYAQLYDVEPALVKAVIRAESGFNRMAISPKGARGLMQLMPKTARLYGVRNVYDPRENIRGGVRHLRMLLDRYRNNVPHVLAAYNAGEAPVERYRGIPPYRETRQYVSRVLRYRQQYLREERLVRTMASSS
jgi:soluble lytic murein transglycosylase-like protein